MFCRVTFLALQDLRTLGLRVFVMVLHFKSSSSSYHVVLGSFLTHLINLDTAQGEILCGAPDLGHFNVVLCTFHFLKIAPIVDTFSWTLMLMDF